MKLPTIFKRESSTAAAAARKDQAEKLVAESLRMLGQVFSKLADAIEAQRLSRSGYEDQEKFLERTDRKNER